MMRSVILISPTLFLLGVQVLKLQWKSCEFLPRPTPFPISGSKRRINFRVDGGSLKMMWTKELLGQKPKPRDGC